MALTVVGLFNTYSEAQQVKQALVSKGYEASHIKVVANEGDDIDSGYDARSFGEVSADPASNFSRDTDARRGFDDDRADDHRGVGDKIKHFFSSLTGGDDDAHKHYATGVNGGGALLAVTTDDDRADEVASLLRQHGARNIDTESNGTEYAQGAYDTTQRAEPVDGVTAIPVVEEELVVGKREVDRGGVRVYSHVVERPVDADVTLRDERINVERRFVDRPATADDFTNATGKVIEMTATGEEAVIGKNSRVVEEILVGKQTSEHTQNIHDTVRKTEVDVEEVPGKESAEYAGTGKNQTY